jgi:transcription antitermination factor NusG
MPDDKRKWYVVYTKPRWEKKVYRLFEERGIGAYCPLNRVRKKWSDRVKWVEEPLFKSYVFVNVAEEELTEIRLVNGVVNFVYWLGKPAVVKEREIEVIRKFLNEYDEIRVEPVELKKDTKVTIRKGALMDKEAKVMKVLNNRVQVVIESIGFALVAVVDKSNIAVSAKQ